MKPNWKPTTKLDNLQRTAALRKTIKVLIAYIRSLRACIDKNDTLHQKELKELTHVISVANRKLKKQSKQLESYRGDKSLIHLQEVVKNQGAKITKYIQIINKYEMEKL